MESMCVACGTPFPPRDGLGFRALCPDCGRELHTCSNCAFYKPGAHYDCAETVQEAVFDKTKANFCEWWKPGAIGAAKPGAKADRSGFDSLFK